MARFSPWTALTRSRLERGHLARAIAAEWHDSWCSPWTARARRPRSN